MLQFQEITPADKPVFDAYLLSHDVLGCHQNFATIYLWAKSYQQTWCRFEDWILVEIPANYGFPQGEGDIRRPVEALREHAQAHNRPLILWGLLDHQKDQLEAAYPGQFSYKESRDSFDYIYDAQKLATLAGKKLHAKRNFINRFEKENPDWSFEPITPDNLEEVQRMNRVWEQLNDWGQNMALQAEMSAISRVFRHYQELDFTGGLLRADGRVVAYSVGSPLGTRAFDVHLEKAYYDVPGAYPTINREMVRHILERYPQVELINREDDNGDDGLRQSKLSYKPEILLRKWRATWIG